MNKFASILLLAPAVALGGEITDRKFEETITNVSAKGLVEVDNTAGSIEIVGTNKKVIVVRGDLDRDVEAVLIESERGRVSIRVRNEGSRRDWDSGNAELVIEVPEASELDITSVSAEIDIRGVTGEQRLRSVSGEIETTAYSKNVVAGSVSGDVTVDGNGGDMDEVRITSVSGDVYGSKLHGEFEASSVSGDVYIRDSKLASGDFSTTSGDIDVSGSLLKGARIQFESVSGDVQLSIDGKHDGSYDLTTFSGDIDNCFGPKLDRDRKRNHRLRFTEGDEDFARIDATTMSGDIEICD